MNAAESFNAFSGLDLLSSAVVLVDAGLVIRHVNPAAENLFEISSRQLLGHPLHRLVGKPAGLAAALDNALTNNWSYTGHNILIEPSPERSLHVDCTVTPVEAGNARLLIEVRPIDQQLRAAREEQLAQQQQANRELVRNLAHEIKNPLGGIRGSAQLLERELDSAPLKEYTQVIIEEADRLQDLMQRLLSSHRTMQPALVNIHEILERVRRLIHAEYHDVSVRRDYDTSLPDVTGDREQLIQAILNISRNAAQAMQGKGEIIYRTRAARKVTLAKKHHELALELQVIDNGPGIPDGIRDKIFYPLVSGREKGSGLGLTIAQSFIQQHGGAIEVSSRPGRTCFSLMLPLVRIKKED
ncbi:nitrogen regulation protein NR(II) [Sulfuritalea sp.]|jgi:two-component system nitrogen regulation sensor histidine kinase GlnL|uniref:nitrogen regulation protein NR(II) n=1 Tax=Sulfuritalea sp. TaxID=2480090 RepID=UPI001ACDE463|nr:nitrogen regulation protein NR(II) [Sulfuritalea sp.]MBN8476537.1 PAS domain-containing protein [Sulfuritalea sp.]